MLASSGNRPKELIFGAIIKPIEVTLYVDFHRVINQVQENDIHS